jgi:hypothetical protein
MNFQCKCYSPRCRKTINGQAWKTKQFQDANWEYLSWYIQNKILKEFGKPDTPKQSVHTLPAVLGSSAPTLLHPSIEISPQLAPR